MADSHLLNTRRAIAHAVSPDGGGKHFELTLLAADGNTGTLDPAFDAHIIPLFMRAWWQKWQPLQSLCDAAENAKERIMVDGAAAWRKVTGPAATLIASAQRIGWTIDQGRYVECDDKENLDLLLDPPAVVVQHARRAVRRWRINNVANMFPALQPQEPDLQVHGCRPGQTQTPLQETVLDFSDVVGSLLGKGVTTCPTFADWSPKFKGDLRSALSGGQWPQTRLASTKRWVDDDRCQLCLLAPGTLAHRHRCPTTRPAGGW